MLSSYLTILLSVSAAINGASAHPHGGGGGGKKSGGKNSRSASGSAKAVYLISNNQENTVAALAIGPNGLLVKGTVTPTGGSGLNSISSATNQSAVPDSLLSQGALTIAGNNLFAVNAGSNTVTMFAISPRDPAKLTMVGQPVPVPAEFPNTVAASAMNSLVCVGSTGAVAGVSCAPFSPTAGIGAMDGLRPFDIGQTTPPRGPANTVSHVFFSADEKTLFATVKGDGMENKGFLAAFPVMMPGAAGGAGGAASPSCGSQGGYGGGGGMSASVSMTAVKSSPSGTALLFGSAPLASGEIFATDASFGAATLSVNPTTLEATTKARAVIADQKATCWVAVSPATGTAFVTDVKFNRLVEISPMNGSVLGTIDLSAVNGQSDLTDLRASADGLVYALSAGNGSMPAAVTVVDVKGTRMQVQNVKLDGLGVGANAMGMAILM